jgi:hypothetical protein
MRDNNEPTIASSPAETFLNSVTASCKSIGHTAEAAKDARKRVYAMNDRFGAHSIFFTVTPDDECTFRVRIYANNGKGIDIPSVNDSEENCIADFEIRSRVRTKYPGACSMYYQYAIRKVFKALGWDLKRNKPTAEGGMFGKVKAFVRADEEQGRGTLHGHFLLWIHNFDTTVRELFSPDQNVRDLARESLRVYVDKIFCADYGYRPSLDVIHEECKECSPLSEMFQDADDQFLRDCRSKSLSGDLQGKVISCVKCNSCKNEERNISTDSLSQMYISNLQRR